MRLRKFKAAVMGVGLSVAAVLGGSAAAPAAHAASAAHATPSNNVWSGPSRLAACHYLRANTANDVLANTDYRLLLYSNEIDIDEVALMSGPGGGSSWFFTTWFQNGNGGYNDDDATSLDLYCNGDLQLRRSDGVVLWDTKTAGKGIRYASLSPYGNFVLTNGAGKVVWQSGTGRMAIPAGTKIGPGGYLVLMPGSRGGKRLLVQMRTDGNLVASAGPNVVWQTNTHVPGSYMQLTEKAQLQVVSPRGRVEWSTRPTGDSYSVFNIEEFGILEALKYSTKILWSCGVNISGPWTCS